MSLLDFNVLKYRPEGNMVVADPLLLDAMVKYPLRELMRKAELSQHMLETIREGQPVRRRTLQRMQANYQK